MGDYDEYYDQDEPLNTDGEPVENYLLRHGRLYEQHKEELREQAARAEAPPARLRLTQKARNIHRDPGPIHEKLYRDQQRIDEERIRKRQEEYQRNIGKFTHEPKVSDRARALSEDGPRGVTHAAQVSAEWAQNREARLEKRRLEMAREALAEMRPKPYINAHSMRIAERVSREEKELMRWRESGPGDFGDRMLVKDLLAKKKRWERHCARQLSEHTGVPRITPHAALLQRQGDVADRLYADAFDRTERLGQLESEIAAAEAPPQRSRSGGPMTPSAAAGRRAGSHEPDASGYTPAHTQARRAPTSRVEDTLLARHEEARRRKDELTRELLEAERAAHRPTINPVSEEIAARLPERPMDRLLSSATATTRGQTARRGNSAMPGIRGGSGTYNEDDDVSAFPFRPAINNRSRLLEELRASRSGVDLGAPREEQVLDRIASFEAFERQKAARLAAMRREQAEQALHECTFEPVTHTADVATGGRDVYERVSHWKRRSEQKMQLERLRKDQRELEQCTFTPQLPSRTEMEHTIAALAAPNQSIYGGDGYAWGYEEHLRRQQRARHAKDASTDGKFADGSTWVNRRTVPVPFKLGRKGRTAQPRSIARPVEPPSRGMVTGGAAADARFANEELDGILNSAPGILARSQAPIARGLFSEKASVAIVDRGPEPNDLYLEDADDGEYESVGGDGNAPAGQSEWERRAAEKKAYEAVRQQR